MLRFLCPVSFFYGPVALPGSILGLAGLSASDAVGDPGILEDQVQNLHAGVVLLLQAEAPPDLVEVRRQAAQLVQQPQAVPAEGQLLLLGQPLPGLGQGFQIGRQLVRLALIIFLKFLSIKIMCLASIPTLSATLHSYGLCIGT